MEHIPTMRDVYVYSPLSMKRFYGVSNDSQQEERWDQRTAKTDFFTATPQSDIGKLHWKWQDASWSRRSARGSWR